MRKTPATAAAAAPNRKQKDLGSALEISTIHQRVRNMMIAKNVDFTLKPHPPPEAALPNGWEERYDSGTDRKFYIDHINKVLPLLKDQLWCLSCACQPCHHTHAS